MQLSPNFSRKEVEWSYVAVRLGIENRIPDQMLPTWRDACLELLEPIRTDWCEPIIIASGYRSPRLNRLIGGSTSSQHRGAWKGFKCAAFDLQIEAQSDRNISDLFKMILDLARKRKIRLDQVIDEYDLSWIHVSWLPEPHEPRYERRTRRHNEVGYPLIEKL